MSKILFYPAFADQESLVDQMFRTVWHFLPMIQYLKSVTFLYSGQDYKDVNVDEFLTDPSKYLSPDFDPSLADYAGRFIGKFKLEAAHEPTDDDLDVIGIVVWNASDPSVVSKAQALASRLNADVVIVDPQTVQQETLDTIRFAYSLWPQSDLERLVQESYTTFIDRAKRWQGRLINVFGNGPSLGYVVRNGIQLEDGVQAICNSTIGDQDALDHLKPELMFCGDPVQHCGVSSYAGRFRQELASALEDENRVVFTQLGYVPYFRAVTPVAHHNRIIGIGNDRRPDFNLDLTTEYLTAATANIFTMLVLPVAFTVSKSVDIYGCDGMPFSAATKPWSHKDEDDYSSRMSVTHRVHKGFWNRNYEEEYWSYSRDLQEILNMAEAQRRTVRVRTPSFVPALAKRFISLPS